jgi:hypothetical protein
MFLNDMRSFGWGRLLGGGSSWVDMLGGGHFDCFAIFIEKLRDYWGWAVGLFSKLFLRCCYLSLIE